MFFIYFAIRNINDHKRRTLSVALSMIFNYSTNILFLFPSLSRAKFVR